MRRDGGENVGITMKEIADLCGVSRGTVDRVLNNRGHVHPHTEERIRSVAESMGYRSTAPVRTLPKRGAPSYKIGVLVNSTDHPYFAEILTGIMSSLESLLQYNISGVMKLSSGFDVDQQLLLLNELLQQGVNALVISPANSPRIAAKLEEFSKRGIPVIFVSSLLEGYEPFASVSCNHYLGGRLAGGLAKLLARKGGKLGITIGSKDMPGHVLRLKGFMDVLQEANNGYTILEPIQSFDDDVIAYKSLSGMLARHPDIDLLFLGIGGFSGYYQAVNDAGLSNRIKIIAFDTLDINLAQLRTGNVSALIDQHPIRQGETAVTVAADYLLRKVVPATRKVYIPQEILIAESLS